MLLRAVLEAAVVVVARSSSYHELRIWQHVLCRFLVRLLILLLLAEVEEAEEAVAAVEQ